MRWLAWAVAGLLGLFTLRRWLLTWAAWQKLAPAPGPPPDCVPSVLVLAPVRNEAGNLPGFLQALARLDCPPGTRVLLIDDGSTDGSRSLLEAAAAGRPGWTVLALPQNVGKAEALNRAMAHAPGGDLLAVYDADERPAPEALRWLIAPFADPHVGGVSGRRVIGNAAESPLASYAAFEAMVHQTITMRGKDYLQLAPALLGSNCAYRRAAVSGFRPGALLEDTDLTLRLARAGWRTRFEGRAVSYQAAPTSIGGYWRQHTRWGRGFHRVAVEQAAGVWAADLSLLLRLELLIFASGYLDRVAVGLAVVLIALGQRWLAAVLAVSLATPMLQVGVALRLAQAPGWLWRRLGWMPLCFLLDVAAAVVSLGRTVGGRPQAWEGRG